MRLVPIVAAALLLGTTATAQQAQIVDYVITPRVFALAGSEEAVIIGGEIYLRTAAGRRASINLVNREGTDGTKLVVVPTDLGDGRVTLRGEFSLTRAGQTTTATFDVLSGLAPRTTIALTETVSGKPIRDQFGRPIYARFDVVMRPRR